MKTRHALLHFVWVALVAMLLSACATQDLDTTNKRVYATELAVEGMLAQIDQYQQEGRFDGQSWDDVQAQLRRLKNAYEAMEMAQAVGDDPGPNIATIHSVLIVLRGHLEETQHE